MLCRLMCIYLLYGSVRREKREEEVTSLISSTIFHVNLFHTFIPSSHVQILFLLPFLLFLPFPSFLSLSFFSLPFLLFLPLVRIFYSSHTSDTDCVNIILDSLPSSLHCVLLYSLHFPHSSSFSLLSCSFFLLSCSFSYSFHACSLSNND